MHNYLKYKVMKSMHFILSIILLLYFSMGCADRPPRKVDQKTQTEKTVQPKAGKSKITYPVMNQQVRVGETTRIILESVDSSTAIDSVIFFAGDKKIGKSDSEPFLCNWNITGVKVGENVIRTLVYYKNNAPASNYVSVVVIPDKKPANLSYQVLNIYPHDIHAYTQGLVYENGYLYEGTGQYNESSLRKVDIKTGELLRILNLPGEIFGEGITILNNKIYQLTYKSQVGFIYDKESLERLQKIYYENKEGWGLTHNGSQLIMSDGSNLIYFMDTEYFTEIGRIEVYDNRGPVSYLNELEYIDGKIFANIYGSDEVVVIDPESGAVIARINFKGILAEKDKHNRIDVFNGIAYNTDNQSLLVTGKYWPKLFEIKLIEKP
jgi:glutamine cyclotransferase